MAMAVIGMKKNFKSVFANFPQLWEGKFGGPIWSLGIN